MMPTMKPFSLSKAMEACAFAVTGISSATFKSSLMFFPLSNLAICLVLIKGLDWVVTISINSFLKLNFSAAVCIKLAFSNVFYISNMAIFLFDLELSLIAGSICYLINCVCSSVS